MDIIRDWWGVILSGVAAVAWLIRLEGQGKANAMEIQRIWKQRAEDLQAHKEAREATNEMLREIREDIKDLLRKVGA